MNDFRIGDHVMALDGEDIPTFGRIESGHAGEWFIRTEGGELTGPWEGDVVYPDLVPHVGYPHEPGALYDCRVCEAMGTLDPD